MADRPPPAGASAAQRFLIVTADDFGRDAAVNHAVAQAAGAGILTAASLMVGAPAAAEAVAIARTLPSLRVGLHVVLTDGRALLPPRELPALVDAQGRFAHSMVLDALRMVGSAGAYRQAAAEIRAQFQAFRATGLELDHVNAHKHFHLHPVLLRLILDIGGEFGLRAVRLPREPLWFARTAGPAAAASALLLRPWLALMRQQLRARGVTHNDQVFGIACSGGLDEATLLAILARLPQGTTEIYLHPAVAASGGQPACAAPLPSGYRGTEELRALTSPRVRAALAATSAVRGGFADLIARIRNAQRSYA
jgi:chitin disaccharide deacetylase